MVNGDHIVDGDEIPVCWCLQVSRSFQGFFDGCEMANVPSALG